MSAKQGLRVVHIRRAVQILFFGIVLWLSLSHMADKTTTPPLCSYCPMGGLAGLYFFLISGGQFLWKLTYANFIILGGLILMGLVVKSGFCGWMCPFGSLQEWINRLFRKIKVRLPRIKNDRLSQVSMKLRWIKYVVLAAVILSTAVTGRLIFRDWDPFLAFFHFGHGNLASTAYLIMWIVLFLSIFIDRFWCKYLCPLGAVIGLIGKPSWIRVQRNEEECTNCQLCDKSCPMNLKPSQMQGVTSVECNSCLDCLDVHPNIRALELKTKGGLKMSKYLYPVIILGN